jgi:glycosyltransferase involved in cell wall biosynthesis
LTEPAILFVTRKWAPATGGMETYSLRLTEALAAIEPVEVVALPGRANGMPPGGLALLTFPLTVLGRALRRRSAPRVLHLGDMALWPVAALALLWRGTQVVLSAHGTDVAYPRRRGLRGTLYGAYLALGARLLPRARVIANSRATAEVAAETGWREAAIVPLGTDPAPAEPADGLHDGFVLFVGRLVERKGCGWFIREVLPLLPAGTRLVVAGTAWDADERAALQAPGVEFLGPVHGAALTELYRRAKCVVVPNIVVSSGEYEGFGLVAPEAAAAGGLVLAARCGGLTDAVIDGTSGLLVEAGIPAAWRDAIAAVSNWDRAARRRFLCRAQAAAIEHFSWDRVARETFQAYAPGATETRRAHFAGA